MSERPESGYGSADAMKPRNLDDHLRRYLENPNGQSRSAAEREPRVDVGRLHQHFLHRLRQHEDSDPSWVERTHHKWSSELNRFVRHIESTAHLDMLGDDASTQTFAANALDTALHCLETNVPLVTKLELRRISDEFEPALDACEYCLETRLAHRTPEGTIASTSFDIGRLLREVLGWVDGAEEVALDLPQESLRDATTAGSGLRSSR